LNCRGQGRRSLPGGIPICWLLRSLDDRAACESSEFEPARGGGSGPSPALISTPSSRRRSQLGLGLTLAQYLRFRLGSKGGRTEKSDPRCDIALARRWARRGIGIPGIAPTVTGNVRSDPDDAHKRRGRRCWRASNNLVHRRTATSRQEHIEALPIVIKSGRLGADLGRDGLNQAMRSVSITSICPGSPTAT
jgi:hypothetical protein